MSLFSFIVCPLRRCKDRPLKEKSLSHGCHACKVPFATVRCVADPAWRRSRIYTYFKAPDVRKRKSMQAWPQSVQCQVPLGIPASRLLALSVHVVLSGHVLRSGVIILKPFTAVQTPVSRPPARHPLLLADPPVCAVSTSSSAPLMLHRPGQTRCWAG